jgi:NTE family protein
MKPFQSVKSSDCTEDFKNVKHLVFAGGGIRGVAYVGALNSIYETTGIDFSLSAHRPQSCTGVSVGSLVSLLICIGYSLIELNEFATSLLTKTFVDVNPMLLLKGEVSIDSGEKLRNYLVDILERKGFTDQTTLLDLKMQQKIKLETSCTDLTTASVVHLNYETYPNLPVIDAVMASMALPIIFPPIKGPNGHLWGDGGILENYPISRYDASNVLGFSFKWKIDGKPDSLLSYILRLVQIQQIPNEICSWRLMKPEHRKRTIMIDVGSISLLGPNWDFALTKEICDALLVCGSTAAIQVMKNWSKQSDCLVDSNDPGSLLVSNEKRILPSHIENLS